ncbi:MAG TPA: hypothetical protein VGR58_08785 [Candidatus Acidoferrum sp.]|nr:hypothetical protein [Candidatus Acidoferrum sp.]
MTSLIAGINRSALVIEIGGIPIRLHTDDPAFLKLLEQRYAGFVSSASEARFELQIELAPPQTISPDEDVRVYWDSGRWSMERGDFRAEWDPATASGRIRQTANPYSIDSVLRILHTLLLATEGGFLVHAASAMRNGRAFLFAGLSGAGKTTIASLAPPDATLLTDEISYVRRVDEHYYAFGTPFTGELARLGENVRAPLGALYLLAQGRENKIEAVSPADAARGLLENILFFARDPNLVKSVFHAACAFTDRVPVRRLTFLPDTRVWEMIA